MRIDTSDVDRFAEQLGKMPGQLVPQVRDLLEQTGKETKEEARKRVSRHRTWRRLAATINYHMFGLAVEVGYDDVGQGELAGIYEYGTSKTNRPPHPTLGPVSIVQAKLFQMEANRIVRRVSGG